VVSDKMQKTVVVRRAPVKDALMGKIITRSKKYHAHVETDEFRKAIWWRSPSAGRSRDQVLARDAAGGEIEGGS
jgi:hypothetical protein